MEVIEFAMFLHIFISVFFAPVCAQIPDVGLIFIGVYDPVTGLPSTDDYVFSFSDHLGQSLPVYALVFSGRNPSQTVPKIDNITISCDVPASSPGFSGVQINTQILEANDNSTFLPLILPTSGRPVLVKCFAQSISATCPAAVGGAQFCPDTSVSNSVLVTIRSPGSISLCDPVVNIKNNGIGSVCSFSVRLSEVASTNVSVNCTSSGGSLGLTLQQFVIQAGRLDGQVTCTVQSGNAGSDTSVTCQAQSVSGTQFVPNNTVQASTARFILGTNTIKFQPTWSEVYNTTFTSFFVLSEPVDSGLVSVTCQASVVSSMLEAESAVRTPDCSFTTGVSSSAPTSTVTTTVTTTIATTTSIVTTVNDTDVNATTSGTIPTPPVTPRPTTPPDPTSLGLCSTHCLISLSTASSTSSSIFQSVSTERLLGVISVRTEIVVTTCCVRSSSSNTNYLGQSAVAVAVAHLSPFVCAGCNNTSFTNPQNERVLQNPGFVEVATCACDLTQNACDINCCCDLDCSQNERVRFSACIPDLPGGQPAKLQDYKCSSNAFNQADWQTLTCVYWENSWFLGMFYMNRLKLQTIGDINSQVFRKYKGMFSLSEPRLTDQTSGQLVYNYGTIVQTIKEDVAVGSPTSKGTLVLSQPGTGAACNLLSPVRYLIEQTSACKTLVTQDQCSALSVLSPQIYVTSSTVTGCSQSFKVLKSLNGSVVTPTDVRYYCATDLSSYIPPSTTSLENLNPTTTSKFPSTLSNTSCCSTCTDAICWQYNTNKNVDVTIPLPSPCTWDDGFTSPNVSTLEGSTCRNVVVDVRYNFEWSGTDITQMSAIIVLADIPNVYTQGIEIVQRFSVNWLNKANATVPLSDNFADTTNTYQRSGSAGYVMGKPLLTGRAEYNGTTGQFNQVDVISEKQIAIWRPGVNGLCVDALRQPVTFGDDALSGCALRLTFSDLNNTCTELRQLLTNHLDVLMAANVVGRYGYNDVNNENMWIPVLRQNLNLSNSEVVVLDNSTGLNATTQELRSWSDSVTGICLVPDTVNLQVLYAQTGAVNGYPRYEVLGAYINYSMSNWSMDCMGVNRGRCDSTSNNVQSFILSSTVTFTQVPASPSVSQSRFDTRCDPDNFLTDSCYRYFTDFATGECYYDTCWQELAYPLLSYYQGDSQLYSLAVFLVLVLGIIAYVSVAKPGWN